ncbi:MAG: hypothetical protein M5U26_24950 [Planctomycetota bacterium]|nr:hypothetical protein [Planctomycetota bacterium]
MIHRMLPLALFALLAAALLTPAYGQDVQISPEKVAQLKRVEPLSAEKLEIFVASGALSGAQRDLVLKHLDGNGQLNLPPKYQGIEPAPPPPAAAPRTPVAETEPARPPSGGVLGWIVADDQRWRASLDRGEVERLKARVQAFRYAGPGERASIKQELRQAGGAANLAVAAFYTDPVDIELKLSLWKAIASKANPYVVGYVAETHKQLTREANALLIPYEKDAGYAVFRRKSGGERPAAVSYTSREIRELVLELEKAISNASGVRAATYLMDVYAVRYNADEAPMRDCDRDRHRMVEACGGDREGFDQDEPDSWACALPAHERALIAERLVPHLQSREKDTRKIAANGLMIALDARGKVKDKLLDDAREHPVQFERWFEEQLARLRAHR